MSAREQGLKLLALDREGLDVISAHAQNTCVRRSDMVWLPKQRRFVLAGMRYDWVGAKTGPAERVSSALRFDRVLRVSHLGLAEQNKDASLNLLAVTFEKTDPPAGMILLAFADGALVRIDVECVEVELCDIGRRGACRRVPGTCADARLGCLRTALEKVMAIELDMGSAEFERRFEALLGAKRESAADVDAVVAGIIDDVRARGDDALAEFSLRFDRVNLRATGIPIGADEVEAAVAACEPDALKALEFAHERIWAYHSRQKPEDLRFTDATGVELGWIWRPVDAVGLYVPGGAASYPSSVLMNAVPAKVAGCRRLAMVVPTPDGRINPLVLAAARIAGVDEIYRIGGAQAVAALAYGTQTIVPVAKIVGPGNAFVAAAKRRVFGVVGIDMIAGPSEVVILADSSANPASQPQISSPRPNMTRPRSPSSSPTTPYSPAPLRPRWTASSQRCRARRSLAPAGATMAQSSSVRHWRRPCRLSIGWRRSISRS